MSAKNKLTILSALCFYPVVSTFLMTLIWQFFGAEIPPFLGGYFYKWVFTYSENNPDWLKEPYLAATRALYFVYIFSYVLIFLLALLSLRRRGKAVCAWGICLLWLADCGWIVAEMIMTGAEWHYFVLLGEHLVFVAVTVLFSLFYLKLKKDEPGLFKKRRRNKTYRNRF